MWLRGKGWLIVWLVFLVSCGPTIPPSPVQPSPTPLALPAAATPSPQPTATEPAPPATPSPSPIIPTVASLPPKTDNLANRAWQMGLGNTGLWQYETNSFIHPRALEIVGEMAYLLDSGRVLRLDLRQPLAPQVILQPGMVIDNVPVLEPFDLTSDEGTLFVLDRAGDVYRYDSLAESWQLDRYDRAVRDVSSHYYVALAAAAGTRFLLETSYKFVQAYTVQGDTYAWLTGSSQEVDMGVSDGFAYVLTQGADQVGQVMKVDAAQRVQVEWQITGELTRPRQLHVTSTSLIILDQAGYRLQAFDPATGVLQRHWRFTQPISTFWSHGERLILAERDTLYFVGQPDLLATISGGDLLATGQPQDPHNLTSLQGLFLPIANTTMAGREFQLPGAPRHYRLGVHEGMDFYKAMGTPVQAVAAGIIIRADQAYVEATERQFGLMRDSVFLAGYTPPDALDFYRGRQIWLQLDNGWVAHYAHLSAIAPGLEVGNRVTAGQVLGNVGNSGSPITQQDPAADVHLHFELWLGDRYLGQFLHPIEIQEWLSIIFRE
ncbi:MAG: M23 family metallopeptidase [Chloroflexi bacterium]|nr:M23 family metallopeptidase [Chloroflexota bacterium]